MTMDLKLGYWIYNGLSFSPIGVNLGNASEPEAYFAVTPIDSLKDSSPLPLTSIISSIIIVLSTPAIIIEFITLNSSPGYIGSLNSVPI